MKNVSKPVIAVAAFACSALFSFGWSEQGGVSLSVESAQARVGRPATPVSVAGVARRQARRTRGYGAAAVGAAAVIGTAAAVAATSQYGGPGYYSGDPYYHPAPGYYGGGPAYGYGYAPHPYAAPNGFVCQPGSTVTLDDGRTYPCQ